MTYTRPDVAYALGVTSRYQANPGYTDASFSSDNDDNKSISGYVFTLNGGAVSWKSSKQAAIADSVTEAEYIAASEAAKEAVWMKKIQKVDENKNVTDPFSKALGAKEFDKHM
ncbi:secreted RxLR effector protein 161-like [Nicotiana tomentosiformis]|uniref:secreted RxLR effector protein 161-like n=1 Tax=Nicotiana tomentosiformis TaxID=4098 RepID=UPI00388C6A3C